MKTTTETTKRGHAALAGSRMDAIKVDPWAVVIVGIDTDPVGRDHPLYDEKILLPLDPIKVAQVKKAGVRLPILVRKNGEVGEVVDGRTRVRWARAATEELRAEGDPDAVVKVPAIIARGDDREIALLKTALNEIREEEPPSLKARKAQHLLDLGCSEDEVALAFGIGVPMLKKRLDVLDLAPEVQKQVDRGELSISTGSKIAKKIPRERQVAEAKRVRETPKVRRPTTKLVRNTAEQLPKGSFGRTLLLWTIGEASEEDVDKAIAKENKK